MSMIKVEASEVVSGQPEAVYATLADYEVGHPAILPKPYFQSLIVQKGGQGAGTEFELVMKVMGVERTSHQAVSEPEPGRVLVETGIDINLQTTFTLEPVAGKTRITIHTEFEAEPGIMGFIGKLMSPPMLRKIYRQELQNLDAYMQQQSV
jgi:hypothetical protein